MRLIILWCDSCLGNFEIFFLVSQPIHGLFKVGLHFSSTTKNFNVRKVNIYAKKNMNTYKINILNLEFKKIFTSYELRSVGKQNYSYSYILYSTNNVKYFDFLYLQLTQIGDFKLGMVMYFEEISTNYKTSEKKKEINISLLINFHWKLIKIFTYAKIPMVIIRNYSRKTKINYLSL